MLFDNSGKEDERPDAADQDALLLTNLRIYDVLMALYNDSNSLGAERLYELHKEGGLGSPMPNFVLKNILSS